MSEVVVTRHYIFIIARTNVLTFQLRLHGVGTCTEWSSDNQLVKLQEIALELAMFTQQRCACPFPPSIITTPRFTCHPPHPQHVTYRASVNITAVQLERMELIAMLEAWPRSRRSILVQGEELSVDDTCVVIIQSLEVEVCEVSTESVNVTSTEPVLVTLTTFLITVVAAFIIAVLATVTMMIAIMGSFRCKRIIQDLM